jgi:hypothetical protein
MENWTQKSQNQSVAKMPQKPENLENITEPIEAKPLIENPESQNQSYLLNPFNKTNSFTNKTF